MSKAKTTTQTSTSFSFPKKKLKIEVINRMQTAAIRDADGSTESVMMMGTSITLPLSTKNDGSGFVNPFKIYAKLEGKDDAFAKEVQEVLEEALGLDYGALNTSLPTHKDIAESHWAKREFKIVMKKTTKYLSSATVTIDLSEPMGFLRYMVALGSMRCANDWASRFDSNEYLVAIRDEEADMAVELSLMDKKAEIAVRLSNLRETRNVNVLFTVFNLLSLEAQTYRPSRAGLKSDSKVDDLWMELFSASEKTANVNKLHDIIKRPDSRLESYYVFFKAREMGMIQQINRSFQHKDGRPLGDSIEEVLLWLEKPENQTLRAGIKAQ